MKAKLIFFLIAVVSLNIQAQFIDNKMDLGIGTGLCAPLNGNSISRADGFVYPSLYGNFSGTPSYRFFISYHQNELCHFELNIDKSHFKTWTGNQEVFIISNPSLSVLSLSANGLYYPERFQPTIKNMKAGIILGPNLTFQSLSGSEFFPVETGQDTDTYNTKNFGLNAGISCYYNMSYSYGLRFDLQYRFCWANSMYYLDNSFNSVSISVYIYFKSLKNKYYWYE